MLIPFGVLSAAGAGVGVAGDYELIASEILGSAQSSVTFGSLGDYSSTYKHLQIRYVARTSRASVFDSGRLRLNGDTGSNFDDHGLFGNGSSVASYAQLNASTGINFGQTPGANAAANIQGPGVIDILDAFSTSKNKVVRELSGVNSSTTVVSLISGSWRNTNSITTIALSPNVGPNWVAGSRFSLYGIRG
jgi:hypothetical protein